MLVGIGQLSVGLEHVLEGLGDTRGIRAVSYNKYGVVDIIILGSNSIDTKRDDNQSEGGVS